MRFQTSLRYDDRASKGRYVWEKYRSILESASVLDVGADEGVLCKHLPSTATYTGVGSSERAGVAPVDLELGLGMFPDSSFDVVLCLDVLEHLERIHHMFDELCRVSRKHVIVSLPNPWYDAWKAMNGRYYRPGQATKFYGLPADRPADRHRWFFNLDEAVAFVQAGAERNRMQVEQVDWFVSGREKAWHRRLQRRLLLRHHQGDGRNLMATTSWYVLSRVGAGREGAGAEVRSGSPGQRA